MNAIAAVLLLTVTVNVSSNTSTVGYPQLIYSDEYVSIITVQANEYEDAPGGAVVFSMTKKGFERAKRGKSVVSAFVGARAAMSGQAWLALLVAINELNFYLLEEIYIEGGRRGVTIIYRNDIELLPRLGLLEFGRAVARKVLGVSGGKYLFRGSNQPKTVTTNVIYMAPKVEDISVRSVQKILNRKGYNAGEIDGLMGPQTRSAIKEYQRNNNLQQTGRIDIATRISLGL